MEFGIIIYILCDVRHKLKYYLVLHNIRFIKKRGNYYERYSKG